MVIPCGHSYCHTCSTNHEARARMGHTTSHCPVCTQTIQHIVDNVSPQMIIKLMGEPDKIAKQRLALKLRSANRCLTLLAEAENKFASLSTPASPTSTVASTTAGSRARSLL